MVQGVLLNCVRDSTLPAGSLVSVPDEKGSRWSKSWMRLQLKMRLVWLVYENLMTCFSAFHRLGSPPCFPRHLAGLTAGIVISHSWLLMDRRCLLARHIIAYVSRQSFGRYCHGSAYSRTAFVKKGHGARGPWRRLSIPGSASLLNPALDLCTH